MAKVVPTQVESPQLIKQNTHYESPAFGSQIEAILLKIKSKQEDTDDGHLASVFFLFCRAPAQEAPPTIASRRRHTSRCRAIQ